MKKVNSMFDVAFQVIHKPGKDPTKDQMIAALIKRIANIIEDPHWREAFGLVDSYEESGSEVLPLSEANKKP